MKVLKRLSKDEPWRDCLERLATRQNTYDLPVGEITSEFDALVSRGTTEEDAAWIVAEGFGLLDEIPTSAPTSKHEHDEAWA